MCKHELERNILEINSNAGSEDERSEEFFKYCSLLIIGVACFTMMTMTLHTWIHRLPRTLELCDVVPSISRPKSTPKTWSAPNDHRWA